MHTRDLRRGRTLPSAPERSKHRARVTLLTFALFGTLASAAALAQIDPDDTGEGVRLGMSQEHNSGQPGIVTLLARGTRHTLVVAQVASAPRDGRERARVARALACRRAAPGALFALRAVAPGQFRAIVPLAAARLLSGNYIVEVFARPGGVRVSCGELHR